MVTGVTATKISLSNVGEDIVRSPGGLPQSLEDPGDLRKCVVTFPGRCGAHYPTSGSGTTSLPGFRGCNVRSSDSLASGCDRYGPASFAPISFGVDPVLTESGKPLTKNRGSIAWGINAIAALCICGWGELVAGSWISPFAGSSGPSGPGQTCPRNRPGGPLSASEEAHWGGSWRPYWPRRYAFPSANSSETKEKRLLLIGNLLRNLGIKPVPRFSTKRCSREIHVFLYTIAFLLLVGARPFRPTNFALRNRCGQLFQKRWP